MARLISADLDRSRAAVALIIEFGGPQRAAVDKTATAEAIPAETDEAYRARLLPLTYSTDRQGKGMTQGTKTVPSQPRDKNETNQQYRQRIRGWIKDVSREARLLADLEASKLAPPTRDDVLADVAPAFTP